ncbi:MAG: FCD domain-containing protein [Cardiobacteriaceae bacterium]|nr:FCD domain-containing protein [Cardiobacteriaceae bacterium]
MNNITTSRRYPEVAAELRQMMKNGQFTVGEKMPAERQLAEQLDVSRALLREALIMLEIQGLVEVRQGSGVYVLRLPDDSVPKTDESDIGPFELMQARQILESSIAEVAALTVTKADIEDLQRILQIQEQEVLNGNTDYSSDEQFHLRVAQATQNSVLAKSVHQLWLYRKRSSMWEQLHRHITHTDYWKGWLEDHRKILNALKRRDPAAARQSMWQHLEKVRETLLKLSDVDAPEFDGYLFRSLPLGLVDARHRTDENTKEGSRSM